jgi:hypothetical protein
MYLVAIAWVYVVGMMALVEATSTTGTLLGAIFTFVLYGVMPLAIVLYLLATPARRAARRAAELAALQSIALPVQPDGGQHAAGEAIATERKEA